VEILVAFRQGRLKAAHNIGFAAIWAGRCKHQLFVRYAASVWA